VVNFEEVDAASEQHARARADEVGDRGRHPRPDRTPVDDSGQRVARGAASRPSTGARSPESGAHLHPRDWAPLKLALVSPQDLIADHRYHGHGALGAVNDVRRDAPEQPMQARAWRNIYMTDVTTRENPRPPWRLRVRLRFPTESSERRHMGRSEP
jgi:hypothetical protein